MPPEQVEVAGGESLTIQLGEPMNDFGYKVGIKLALDTLDFVQFDRETRTLTIQANQTDVGIYEIAVILESDSIDE